MRLPDKLITAILCTIFLSITAVFVTAAEQAPYQYEEFYTLNKEILENLKRHYNLNTKRKSIMNIGDSISESRAFMWQMRWQRPGLRENDEEGYIYIEKELSSASNMTSGWGRKIIDGALEKGNPEFATIMFGTNDVLSGVSIEAYGENMLYIVKACLKRGTIPLLCTIPPCRERELSIVENFNQRLREIAKEEKIPLFDVYKFFLSKGNWQALLSDGIHPSANDQGTGGYNIMDDVIFEVYKRLEKEVMLREKAREPGILKRIKSSLGNAFRSTKKETKVIYHNAKAKAKAYVKPGAFKREHPYLKKGGYTKESYTELMREKFNIAHPEYTVGVDSAMARVSYLHPLFQFSGEISDTYHLKSARHEYENFQINIAPLKKDLKNIKIEFTDLLNSATGEKIDKKNIKFYVEGFVETKKSWPVPDELLGWKPDPLLEKPGFDVKLGEEQPMWITVYTPPDAASGDYEAEIIVHPQNSHIVKMKLNLHVWDFTLPLAGHLRTPTTLDIGLIKEFYGYDNIPDTVLKDYYDILLEHRIDPTSLYHSHISPAKEYLDYCIVEKGLRTITLGYLPPKIKLTPEHETLLALKEITAFLKDKGWLDKAVLYIGDEVGPQTYETLKNNAMLVKEHCPGLKLMAGIAPKEELFGYVDVWDPIMADDGEMKWNAFIPEVCQARQKAGDEVMWYVAASPNYPYPNVKLDNPLIDSRVLFWITWKYAVTGFEYYYINLWGENVCGINGKKWPDIPWNSYSFVSKRNAYNGDGMLVYPGPEGKPYSSVRLENIRDGIEDYECFWILRERLDKITKSSGYEAYQGVIEETKEILEIEENIVKNMKEFTREPRKIIEARNKVSAQIEKLDRILLTEGIR